jgi:hypothetical protein
VPQPRQTSDSVRKRPFRFNKDCCRVATLTQASAAYIRVFPLQHCKTDVLPAVWGEIFSPTADNVRAFGELEFEHIIAHDNTIAILLLNRLTSVHPQS